MSEIIQSEAATSEIKVRSRVGSDGVLHLDIPTSMKDQSVEVTVMVTPVVEPSQKTPEEFGWSPGFFEKTFGKWEGEPLERGEQGDYEQRDWDLM
ncbi:MAG: hypothetical protein KME43_13495 [Myxacorys chilensis ATA2-1-KO14]|jgi:hypothetical protein|nr:hypothetical protein [Myxacorys chilensis ATA2-1-KO14]